MTKARRTDVLIKYKGADISRDLAPFLSNFVYSDNEGKSDEIQSDLLDRDKKWQDPWLPNEGDKIQARIRTVSWDKDGEVLQLNCGTFFVDDVTFKGPPDSISIKALSVPFKAGGKSTKRTRAWENSSLNTIAGDIAISSNLTLIYDAPNYFYERVDQSKETDLAFIKRMAKREGLSVKVSDEKLVIYHQLTYERKKAVRTLTRGEGDILFWDFARTSADKQYKKVQISYFDGKKKKAVKYVYDVPDVESGPTLKIDKRAKDLAEAKRWAKAEARNKNKKMKSGKLTISGAIGLVQGLTVNLKKFGAFDGKYFIEACTHNPTGKYEVNIDIREVLGY